MANNIKGGAPNAVVAKTTVSFATAGITALNTEIIYLVDDPLKSYVPGRTINGISGFEANKGYYLVAKLDMDLESLVVPPVAGVTQLATPGSFTATQASSTQINLSWAAVTNATAYVVDRATNSGFTTGVTLAIYSGSGTSYNNTGLTASTTYYYRVRATASGYSDSAYATANATTAASSSYDTNAQAFFTAAGITDTTQKDAVNQLVLDFKAAGIWTKHYAIYPIVGGTVGTHAVNLKTPGTFNFIFNGGWTHNSNGAKPNGTTGYADSQFCPFQHSAVPGQLDLANLNSFNFAYYSGDNVDPTTDEMLFGCANGSDAIQWDDFSATSRFVIFGNAITQTIGASSGTFSRLCELNRTSNVLAKAFRDGTQIGTNATTTRTAIDVPERTIYFGGLNSAGTLAYPTARGMRFAAIADGLTDSEVTARKTAINAFQTSLSRAL
jgi:hypothetical protein